MPGPPSLDIDTEDHYLCVPWPIPLRLGSICRHCVVYSSTRMFSGCMLVLPVAIAVRNQLLDEWLAHSTCFGPWRLSPVERGYRCLGFNNMYGRHTQAVCQRWNVLNCHTHQVPTDVSGCVEEAGTLIKGSPQYVSISNTACWDITGFYWCNVSLLELDRFTLLQVWDILRQAPKLEDLDLREMEMESSATHSSSTIIRGTYWSSRQFAIYRVLISTP